MAICRERIHYLGRTADRNLTEKYANRKSLNSRSSKTFISGWIFNYLKNFFLSFILLYARYARIISD